MDRETFMELIPKGSDHRITSRELGNLTGMGGQEIRALINALRSEGKPIASDSNGYFIATTYRDIALTVRSLEGRVAAIERARDGLREAMFNLIMEEEQNAIHDFDTTEDEEEQPENYPS